jgi:multicomponent Na+:H+ antiporter subunit D
LIWRDIVRAVTGGATNVVEATRHYHGLDSALARGWPTGNMAFWMSVMLAAYLLLSIF